MNTTKPIFLTAEWQHLVMVNYAVPPAVLQPYLPKGTTLDLYNEVAYMSLVGFLFAHTKVLGIAWPWHSTFEEVNLRYYIQYNNGTTTKRGVHFISEIVPKPIIAYTANLLYNEHYQAMPMRHSIVAHKDATHIAYHWQHQANWNSIQAVVHNTPEPIAPLSHAEYILEHYWGYNESKRNRLIEYGVEHERWQLLPLQSCTVKCNAAALYGTQLAPYLASEPHSVYVAQGSPVVVRKPSIIKVLAVSLDDHPNRTV